MKKIKMVDLHDQYLQIKTEIDRAIQDVLTTTAFIQGPQVPEFAEALKQYTGANKVIPCANGTDALQIAMMALDLKPGDEVILPVFTYVATAEVLALLNLVPVFVDVVPDTFQLNVNQVEDKISARTKAIVPVHLFGQCADMEPLLLLAKKYGLFVIEDAAQSLGATYTFASGEKKQAGTMGTIGTTSFFPSKNLGCFGDGGAIFTNDVQLADRIGMIANHGQRIKYHHEIIGVNSRLDTLQASILTVKLRYLDSYAKKRNEAAAFYDGHLRSLPAIILPSRSAFSTHVFHQYTVQIKERSRDEFQQHLAARGIPSMIYYPIPLHFQKAYARKDVKEGAFPVSEALSKTVISLPMHTELDEEQLSFICETIREF